MAWWGENFVKTPWMKCNNNQLFYCMLLFLVACRGQPKTLTLPFYNTPDFTPQWLAASDKNLSSIHTIKAFSFTNQDGKMISTKNVAHKIYVANFFFTTCGSICPRMMANLQKIQQAFATDNNVQLLSFSVLPEVDSVARLKKYALQRSIDGNKWWLLTGNKDSIYNLARRSYFADEALGYNKGSNEFLHTENFILVDGKSRIRGVYNGTQQSETDKLIEHIKLLEKEALDD